MSTEPLPEPSPSHPHPPSGAPPRRDKTRLKLAAYRSPEPARMVGWYEPKQLAPTAWNVLVSTLFGRRADARLLEAYRDEAPPLYDYSQASDDHGDFWIDYVADVGDGWDSTYAVAHALSQPTLQPQGCPEPTRRGRILVFGGDEVYPVADGEAYRSKLVTPYQAALGATAGPPRDVFAIPGNHDWYDGLVAFTRLFCGRDRFAGLPAPQARSYFALKLPRGWWLLGTDVQLDSDVDAPQLEFFRRVSAAMEAGDRVILCNAEPHWIYEERYGNRDARYNQRNLERLEAVLDRRVQVFLAGDLHHYRRHATADGKQKITAGGGGAFLHPTHGDDVGTLRDGYELKASFPAPKTSRRLSWGNLLFLIRNPRFGIVTGLAYMLTAWSARTDLSPYGIRQIGPAARAALRAALSNPAAPFWGLALLAGFLLFTDTHSRRYRQIAGSIHGLTHVLAAFFIAWATTCLTAKAGLPFGSTRQLLAAGGIIVAAGWVTGSVILGLYLFISLNVFGRHSNEAFSSLGITDWKHFLRFRIDRDGLLTLFPIGLRRVPRRWQDNNGSDGVSKIVPNDRRATPPELIEGPIPVGRAGPLAARVEAARPEGGSR